MARGTAVNPPKPLLQRSLPSEQREVVDARIKVTTILDDQLKLKPPVGRLDLPELRRWAKSLPDRLKPIEDATNEIMQNAHFCYIDAKEFQDTGVQLESMLEKEKLFATKLQEKATEGKLRLEAIASKIIRDLKVKCGDELFHKIIETTLQPNEQTNLASAPAPTLLANAIPQSIIAACKEYLPGAATISTWNSETICELLKDTRKEIRGFRAQVHESQPTQSLEYLEKSASQFYHHSQKVEDESEDVLFPPPQLYSSISTNGSPTTSSANTTDISSISLEQDTGIDRLREDLGTLEEELCAVKSDRDLLTSQHKAALAQIETHKLILLRNHERMEQIDDATAELLSAEFRLRHASKLTSNAPFLRIVTSCVLADAFPTRTSSPARPYSIRYLQTILEDIWEVSSEGQDNDAGALAHIIEEHIPWVCARIPEIVTKGSRGDTAMLLSIIENAINSNAQTSIARSALLLSVANLARRPDQIRNSALWHSLYSRIMLGRTGQIHTDWDLLERICFLVFMSANDQTAISKLDLDDNAEQKMYDLIADLRRASLSDFIRVPRLPCIKNLISFERDNYSIESLLLTMSAGKNEELAILRTGKGIDTEPTHEYVWSKKDGVVKLTEDGFDFRCRYDKLETRPLNGQDCWF